MLISHQTYVSQTSLLYKEKRIIHRESRPLGFVFREGSTEPFREGYSHALRAPGFEPEWAGS
jgi:hypothetical protein